jgi:hypothetical protein
MRILVNLLKFRRSIAIAALVAAAAGTPSGWAAELTVAGRSSANPSIAATGQFVAVAWGATTTDGPTDIYAAASRDGGRTFGSPVRVNDVAGEARLSGEQPPRVALVPRAGREPSLVVVWTARAAAGTRLLSARSDDGGKTFTRATALPGSNAPGSRGWEATATDRDGRVVAIWLDHRELAKGATAPMSHAEHQHTAKAPQQSDGVARAQLSKLLFARLDRSDSARELTGGVCYCCKTTIAAGADGAIYAAWRHVYPGNIRDIAFTVSRDGGRTFAPPARVSDDRWVLDGCPENGPAMAVDNSGRVHVVWPTLVAGAAPGSEPTLALYYAVSLDGRQFSPRQRIPTEGVPRHPQIVLDSSGVVVTWDEQAPGSRRVAVGRGTADRTGTIQFAREVVSTDGRASYPAVASTGDGLVLAWTAGSAGQTVVETERLPIRR